MIGCWKIKSLVVTLAFLLVGCLPPEVGTPEVEDVWHVLTAASDGQVAVDVFVYDETTTTLEEWEAAASARAHSGEEPVRIIYFFPFGRWSGCSHAYKTRPLDCAEEIGQMRQWKFSTMTNRDSGYFAVGENKKYKAEK